MKTFTLKMIPVATMVAALGVAPYAFAGDWHHDNDNHKDAVVSLAIAKNKQSIGSQDINKVNLNNTTDIEQSLFSYGSGMANLNLGTGADFAQNNSVAISALLKGKTSDVSLAKAISDQKLDKNLIKDSLSTNVSTLKSYAFDHFGGMANVNLGTGTGYAQNNSVAISAVGH